MAMTIVHLYVKMLLVLQDLTAGNTWR